MVRTPFTQGRGSRGTKQLLNQQTESQQCHRDLDQISLPSRSTKSVFTADINKKAEEKRIDMDMASNALTAVGFALAKWAVDKIKGQKSHPRLQFKNRFEEEIRASVINPDTLSITLEEIGGLQEAKEVLRNEVLRPFLHPELFNTSVLCRPKGILFYGLPGTGKTMLAKALAKEANARFIYAQASTLESKWVGESAQRVKALFNVAVQLQPTIIFIDEVDGLLGSRDQTAHQTSSTLKTEMMQEWDGIGTNQHARVMVLGATNRPGAVDAAFLRRFTVLLEIRQPDSMQRQEIVRTILSRQDKEAREVHGMSVHVCAKLLNLLSGNQDIPRADVAEADLLQNFLASTEGWVGSQLAELCRRAIEAPIHEYLSRNALVQGDVGRDVQHGEELRAVTLSDLLQKRNKDLPRGPTAHPVDLDHLGRDE